MTLRRHQKRTDELCSEILSGAPIKSIIEDVTPGGGKSKLPIILANRLLGVFADKILWVVPRNSLKYQGEEEFVDSRFPTIHRLRATHGNDHHPDRGTDGYITTYQAIGQEPEQHQDYVRKQRVILFLDEPHHVADDSSWADALAPMIEDAVLVVYASGTLSRGDGQKIAFLEYLGNHINLRDTEHVRTVRYTRSEAIADKSILPVHGRTIDGAAEWISAEGIHRKIDSLASSGSDRSAAVFTALRTDYAYQLLDACIDDWNKTRATYPSAKLLIVAPNIEFAKLYHQYVARWHLAEIATSEDSVAARKCIDAFKRGVFPILVTVAMAYEGLSVPSISHIACLTEIRSVPWLEQCFARANRVDNGKDCGIIYGPSDPLFIQAMRMIENEQLPGLKDQDEKRGTPLSTVELVESVSGPEIEPLWSLAHGLSFTQSQMETALIGNIRAIRSSVLSMKRAGNQQTAERLFNLRIRQIVDKDLKDMTTDELQSVWLMLRDKYQ